MLFLPLKLSEEVKITPRPRKPPWPFYKVLAPLVLSLPLRTCERRKQEYPQKYFPTLLYISTACAPLSPTPCPLPSRGGGVAIL